MKKQLENITEITDKMTYKKASAYLDELIAYATENGYLDTPEADNKYTGEIVCIGEMIADYESIYMEFKHLNVKSPLIVSIEKEM